MLVGVAVSVVSPVLSSFCLPELLLLPVLMFLVVAALLTMPFAKSSGWAATVAVTDTCYNRHYTLGICSVFSGTIFQLLWYAMMSNESRRRSIRIRLVLFTTLPLLMLVARTHTASNGSGMVDFSWKRWIVRGIR